MIGHLTSSHIALSEKHKGKVLNRTLEILTDIWHDHPSTKRWSHADFLKKFGKWKNERQSIDIITSDLEVPINKFTFVGSKKDDDSDQTNNLEAEFIVQNHQKSIKTASNLNQGNEDNYENYKIELSLKTEPTQNTKQNYNTNSFSGKSNTQKEIKIYKLIKTNGNKNKSRNDSEIDKRKHISNNATIIKEPSQTDKSNNKGYSTPAFQECNDDLNEKINFEDGRATDLKPLTCMNNKNFILLKDGNDKSSRKTQILPIGRNFNEEIKGDKSFIISENAKNGTADANLKDSIEIEENYKTLKTKVNEDNSFFIVQNSFWMTYFIMTIIVFFCVAFSGNKID